MDISPPRRGVLCESVCHEHETTVFIGCGKVMGILQTVVKKPKAKFNILSESQRTKGSLIFKGSFVFTPYRMAASVPLALRRCVEPFLCRRSGLSGWVSKTISFRRRSWPGDRRTPEEGNVSEFSASNSSLSWRASNGLAGASATESHTHAGKVTKEKSNGAGRRFLAQGLTSPRHGLLQEPLGGVAFLPGLVV